MKIAVIGAGPCGLATTKELKEEKHQVTCFVKRNHIGGVFFYAENKDEGSWKNYFLTSSEAITAFSDFPPKEFKHKQWTRAQYLRYLQDYAKKFKLTQSIQLNHDVLKIEKNRDGKWEVKVKKVKTDQVEVFLFEAIAICAGAFNHASFPKDPKLQKFTGKALHSSQLGDFSLFKEKRILIVGIGESGSHVVEQACRKGKACTLLARRIVAAIPRYLHSLPGDYNTTRSLYSWPKWYFRKKPKKTSYIKWIISKKHHRLKKTIFYSKTYAKYSEEFYKNSSNSIWKQFLNKTTKFAELIEQGKCHLETRVLHVEGKKITFPSGTRTFDIIAYSTGFTPSFPYLQKNLVPKEILDLYLGCYTHEESTLCFIGFLRPAAGSIPPMAEMQARYFAQICSKKKSLPVASMRKKEALLYKKTMKKFFSNHKGKMGNLVDYVSYMDKLALLIGVMPPIYSTFFTNLKLNFAIWQGPFQAAQYRLKGPHAKPRIAKKILSDPNIEHPSRFIKLIKLHFKRVLFKLIALFGAKSFDPDSQNWEL